MKFNEKTIDSTKTTNHEGEVAYKLSSEMELYTAVVTSVLEPKFYESSSLTRITNLIPKVDPEFVNNLAIYTRNKMYLRSVPLVLVTELAKLGKLKKETVKEVIQRADEITELLSCYSTGRKNTKKLNNLSHAILNGIRETFESDKFDEYNYGKYARKTAITFKDAVFVTHPNPKRNECIQKIVDGTLNVPFTWETQLSEKGNTKEVWEELIDSKKVGYMATLRNLRNILNADVSDKHITQVCDYLSNEESVKYSKQLPFRFLSAYRELKDNDNFNTPKVLAALELAIKHSSQNVKGYDSDTRVMIACDVSGSMQHPISRNSSVELYDIGLVLGMILKSRCKSVLSGMFGDTFKVINQPTNNILSNADEYREKEGCVGYSTNGYKVLDHLVDTKIRVDKVMMFTDCQMYDSGYGSGSMKNSWKTYKKLYPNSKLYLFDLSGYGTTPLSLHSNDVFLISGWSNEIFNVLHSLEGGSNIIEHIKTVVNDTKGIPKRDGSGLGIRKNKGRGGCTNIRSTKR